eukprot:5210680-Prymnesium_polylepis.1
MELTMYCAELQRRASGDRFQSSVRDRTDLWNLTYSWGVRGVALRSVSAALHGGGDVQALRSLSE